MIHKRLFVFLLSSLLLTGTVFAQLSVPDSLYKEFTSLKKKTASSSRDSLMVSILFELVQHMHPIVGIPWNDSLRIYTYRINTKFGYLLNRLCYGDSLNLRGNFKAGTEVLLQASKELEQHEYFAHAAFGFIRLGATGDYLHQSGTKAIDPMNYYNHALYLARKSGHDDFVVQVMSYIADHQLEKKEYSTVIKGQLEAENIIRSKKNSPAFKHYWSVIYTLGTAYLHLKQEEKARVYFKRALQLISSPGKRPYLEYSIYNHLARYYYKEGQYKKMIKQLEIAEYFLKIWKANVKLSDGDKYLADVYEMYYNAYKAINNLPKAIFYLEETQKQRATNIKNEMSLQYNELYAKYEVGEAKIKISQLENDALNQENLRKKQFNFFLIITVILLLLIIVVGYLLLRLAQKNTQALLEISQVRAKMATQIIQTQDSEQQRIAADLHDDLGGTIASVNAKLSQLASIESINQIKQGIVDALKISAKAGDQIRLISHNLMPPDLEKIGLVSLIQERIAQLNENEKPQFSCLIFGTERRLSSEQELNIYRILSELIHNIQKHAQAKVASVQFFFHADMLTVTIEDDGVGYTPEKNQEKRLGIGLKNVFSRVNYLHACLHTESSEQGTTAILEIPYDAFRQLNTNSDR
jgi:signal transduction histidine kinase